MNDIYSVLKPAWHIDRIDDLRKGVPVIPVQVQLVIADLCNQDCNFCTHRISNGTAAELFAVNGNTNPKRFIPTEKCIEILDDCERLGVKSIQFTGGGEPTVHADHLKIFDYAQRRFKTGLITNGYYLKDLMIYKKFDWIRISLDAATHKTYSKIRRHTGYDTVIQNIEYLANNYDGVLGIGFVVTNDNYREMYDACLLARELNVDYIRFGAVMSNDGAAFYKDTIHSIRSNLKKVSELETRTFKIYDLFNSRINDLDQGHPEYKFCGYQYMTVYIGGDQKVYRCCTTSYTKHGEVGDLKKERFREWVLTHNRNFDAGDCSVCQFNDKNRVINYMMDTPAHVEFV